MSGDCINADSIVRSGRAQNRQKIKPTGAPQNAAKMRNHHELVFVGVPLAALSADCEETAKQYTPRN